MRLAVVAAGFTPGEADQLRRAMGAWRKTGVIEQFRKKLIDGMAANGHSLDFAERLFKQIRGFGEYGFPESHAASFALLVYVSAWLKLYYPAAFVAALINSQPMGFYAPAQLVADARKHGVDVRPADVNWSEWDCTLEPAEPGSWALRLGLRMIAGLQQSIVERIVDARGDCPFCSMDEFARRAGASNSIMTRLSRADAFGSLGINRREALWQSLPEQKTLPLFDDLADPEPQVPLSPLSPVQEVVADYRTQGLSLRDHPVKFMRERLSRLKAISSADLSTRQHGDRVAVAGLVLMRQRPSTAKGITFVTLEDETGVVNLIVRADVWERYHQIARRAQALLARGTVQRRDKVIHVFIERLQNLSHLLAGTDVKSRDFR